MGETPSLFRKRLLRSKPLAAIGVVLMMIGGLAFLNSLGSGGGYFPATLIVSGAGVIVGAIVKSI